MMKKLFPLLFLSAALLADETDDPLRDSGRKGDREAMLKLAHEYFHGLNSRRPDPTVAAYWYRRAAEAGVPEGMYNYAVCLINGSGVHRNRYEAVQWFRKAADAGVLMARLHVAGVTISGLPADRKLGTPEIPPLPEYGLSLLKDLAEERFQPAELLYARMLLRRGKPEEIPQAVSILNRLAALENPPPEALRMLADCKYGGIGMKKDPAEMIRLLRRASKSGDAEALGKLAFCYEYGRAVPVDLPRAFNLYRLSAERGNAMAQFKYAEFLANGTVSGKQELAAALPWYQRAAEQNNPQALFRLGVFCLEGIGMKKSEREASELFFRAAKQGYARAQYNLACMYAAGQGDLEKDETAAVYWFTLAAQKGDTAAQRALGLRYLEGRGVTRSITRGEEWLRRAAKNGDDEALRILRTRGLLRPVF